MRTDPFFPGVALALAAMLWTALAPGLAAQERWRAQVESVIERGYVIDVTRLRDLTAAPGTTAVIDGDGLSTRAVMRATHGVNDGLSSPGVFYTLPPAITRIFANNTVRITLTARRTRQDGSERFAAAYFLVEGDNSGWREFAPGEEFANFTFDWAAPPVESEHPALISVWPNVDGDDRGIELRRIVIEIAPEIAASA